MIQDNKNYPVFKATNYNYNYGGMFLRNNLIYKKNEFVDKLIAFTDPVFCYLLSRSDNKIMDRNIRILKGIAEIETIDYRTKEVYCGTIKFEREINVSLKDSTINRVCFSCFQNLVKDEKINDFCLRWLCGISRSNLAIEEIITYSQGMKVKCQKIGDTPKSRCYNVFSDLVGYLKIHNESSWKLYWIAKSLRGFLDLSTMMNKPINLSKLIEKELSLNVTY